MSISPDVVQSSVYEQIKTVLQELGQDTTAEDLKDILVALDSNDDGHISFDGGSILLVL